MCKMIIPSDDFSFFRISIFQVSRVKRQKRAQNDKKIWLSHSLFLRKHTSYDRYFWYTSPDASLHISGTVPHMVVVFGTLM